MKEMMVLIGVEEGDKKADSQLWKFTEAELK